MRATYSTNSVTQLTSLGAKPGNRSVDVTVFELFMAQIGVMTFDLSHDPDDRNERGRVVLWLVSLAEPYFVHLRDAVDSELD